ncbi:hypothetical protein [Bacillus velezensis]|uniref:hypothetical protein n=1 Tax=Bacillus velezensis TaxID=492670 RepID=UPI003AAA737C
MPNTMAISNMMIFFAEADPFGKNGKHIQHFCKRGGQHADKHAGQKPDRNGQPFR